MFTKQQGNGNKGLQGNKGRLMQFGPLTHKHAKHIQNSNEKESSNKSLLLARISARQCGQV